MAANNLAQLKSQLRTALQQVAQRENVLAAAAEKRAIVPQTIAQVDALTTKLTEALEELRARRAELEKAAEPTGATAAKATKATKANKSK
jgi:adenylosuccinate lyase